MAMTEAEQEAAISRIEDDWIAVGLSTGRADRATVEAALDRAYVQADLAPPGLYIWCDSPFQALRAAAAVEAHGANEEKIRAAMDDPEAQLSALVPAWGCLEAYRLALWDAYEALSGEAVEGCEPLRTASREISWWFPFNDVCIVTERPDVLTLDGNGLLHGDRAPAIAWADGAELFYIHGVEVDGDVYLHPEALTPAKVMAEPNAERRRVYAGLLGWDKLLADAHLVSEEGDPQNAPFTLKLYDAPEGFFAEGQDLRIVVMHNATVERDGTRRVYAQTVPAEITSAVEAVAWTFGVPVADYQTLERAT